MTRVVKNPSGFHSKGRNGVEKAQQFGTYAKQYGWSGKYHLDEDTGIVYLFARRGDDETIEIWWSREGKALPRPDLPVYTLNGERVKLLNVSAIAAMAAKDPDEVKSQRARKRHRKHNAAEPVTQETIASLQGSLPFDHESSDDELKTVLVGKTITWVNRMSGDTDTATIAPKQFKVVRNGHDYISFVYAVDRTDVAETYGFRAVYLDSIVSVS